jgi:hypothetical protein
VYALFFCGFLQPASDFGESSAALQHSQREGMKMDFRFWKQRQTTRMIDMVMSQQNIRDLSRRKPQLFQQSLWMSKLFYTKAAAQSSLGHPCVDQKHSSFPAKHKKLPGKA